jgi:hypothetical protein
MPVKECEREKGIGERGCVHTMGKTGNEQHHDLLAYWVFGHFRFRVFSLFILFSIFIPETSNIVIGFMI